MRQLLAICFFELKRLLKRPRSYLIMFVTPLVFTFFFGGLLSGTGSPGVPIALVDLDQSIVSKSLVEQWKKEKILSLQVTDIDQANALREDKKISGTIIIPKNFQAQLVAGNKASLEFTHSPDLAVATAIEQLLDNSMATAAIQVKGAQQWSHYSKGSLTWEEGYKKLAAEVSTQEELVQKNTIAASTAKSLNQVSQSAAGFSIMFIMIQLMMVTSVFLDARKTGVWGRILSTPSSRVSIVGGYLLSFFLMGWFQFAVLMGLTHLLFGVVWGDLLALIILISAFLLSTVGLGLAIAGFVRTSEQQAAIGNLVIVSTSMLGGVFWPLEVVPAFMQKIAQFVPQTWAMKGFTELMARGGGVGDILGAVAILMGFAVVFLAMGIARIRYE